MDMTPVDGICLVLVVVLSYRLIMSRTRSLPPGPRGYPLIGNLFDMPATQEWLAFAQWGDKYGECNIDMFVNIHV